MLVIVQRDLEMIEIQPSHIYYISNSDQINPKPYILSCYSNHALQRHQLTIM